MKTDIIKVLIVEDSEDDFAMLLRELNKSPYEFEYELVDTEPGFEKALSKKWDIVISDYSLPGFTGYDVLRTCNAKAIDAPFIMVSGTIGEDLAVEMMKAGAKDYIMKNNLARLLPAIARELEDAKIRSERKKAEKALEKSEKLYHNLFEQANEGLVLMTFDGKLSKVNKAFAEMHGYTKDELKKMDIKDIVATDEVNHEEGDYVYRRSLAGEVSRFEENHYHKDGYIFPVSVTYSKINSDNEFYLAYYEDITERKHAEAAMKKRIEDLEWFNSVSVGRELKMIELKKEVNELLKRLGLEDEYIITE